MGGYEEVHHGVKKIQHCANMCAKREHCDHFIFGKKGTEKEGDCIMEKEKCKIDMAWENYDTYIVNDGTFKSYVEGYGAPFKMMWDNGCREQLKIVYHQFHAEIQSCANHCAKDSKCTMFLHGRTGDGSEHGDHEHVCALAHGKCEKRDQKHGWKENWIAFELLDASEEKEVSASEAKVTGYGQQVIMIISATAGLVFVVGVALFLHKLRNRSSGPEYQSVAQFE